MEATSVRRKPGGRRLGDLFSTRRNTIIVAVISAVLAGALLFAFVQQYRNDSSAAATTPTLVATGLIPRGTSAGEIAATQLYRRTTIKQSLALVGAITDASALQGKVAAVDIYPGQQLTAADFSATNVTIASQLHRTDRAIAVPVDATHGLIGFVQAGDRVDILVNIGGRVSPLAQNILVLNAPGGGGGGGLAHTSSGGGGMVIRMSDAQIVSMASAADNGKIWFVLRPPVGALQ